MLSALAGLHRVLARIVAVAVVVFTLAVAASLLVDRVNPPVAVVDPGIASVDSTKHSRLLILHIDSWRYETAIDSTIMPQVARLRRQGASWELEGVFEGFTIPAVRAAFSGHAETQLVSVIQNFSFHALPIGSFFLDAHRLGKRTLVVAQEPWVQFGPYFEQRVPEHRGQDMYALDHERPAMALRAFQNETFDIVICHYESADWVAHETGINSDRYRREFAYADSQVAGFAAARAPNDYLLVYGDHGHSPAGEHKTGISIPTFGLLLGPDVKPGVTTAPLAMTNLRYIVSHAMGITLRAAPYDTRELARFLPVASDSVVAVGHSSQRVSQRASDYALAIGAALIAGLTCFGLTRLVGGASISTAQLAAAVAVFIVELYIQQRILPTFSVFPPLCIAFAIVPSRQHWLARVAIGAVGVWFAAQLIGVDALGAGLSLTPTSLRALVPLYVFAVAAKLLVLVGTNADAPHRIAQSWGASVRNRRNLEAVAWTTALALLEFRVWDHPAASGILIAAGIVALWRSRDPASRRVAHIVILQSLIYFTLRLPLYQLAWIDLFFAALLLIARERDNLWVDVLTVTGTFTLTCGWLASTLEWSFLYTVFPAHLVEMQVQYFGPLILAKIPLLLVLAYVIIGRVPTRRLAKLLLAYTALRFAAAWILRLSGAPGADLWPLAEQGMYLATFVVAAVAWGWQGRASATGQHPALVTS